MKAGLLEVYEGKRAHDAKPKFYWRLVAANGKTIADGSEGYASRSNAKRAARRARWTMIAADNLNG